MTKWFIVWKVGNKHFQDIYESDEKALQVKETLESIEHVKILEIGTIDEIPTSKFYME